MPMPGAAGMATPTNNVVVVRGSGSTAVDSLMDELTFEFMQDNPQATVTYDGFGSAEGAPPSP